MANHTARSHREIHSPGINLAAHGGGSLGRAEFTQFVRTGVPKLETRCL